MLTITATIKGDSMGDIEAGLDEIREALTKGNTSGFNEGEDNREYRFDRTGSEALFSSEFSAEIRRNIRESFRIHELANGRRYSVEFDSDRSRWWVKVSGKRAFAVVDLDDAGGDDPLSIDFEEVR